MRIAGGRSAIGVDCRGRSRSRSPAASPPSPPTVSPTAAEGATIIFESIDGPPRPVSTRLAQSLDQEAAARRLVVVTRGGQALYHIRAYLAAHTEGGATALAWAFDVYDAERKRAFRLRGEERAVGPASWAAANDAMLQRIASTSIDRAHDLHRRRPHRSHRRGGARAGPGVGRPGRRFPAGCGRPAAEPRILAYSAEHSSR